MVFRLKRLWNCQQFAKNIRKIRPTVLEISYFKEKISFKFCNLWIWNAYFWPLGAQMGPNFRFYVLFLFSDKKQRVWYITRGIFPAFLENRFFYPILQYCQFSWNRVPSENERSKKKTDAFFGFGMKNFIFSNVVFHFLRSNLDFTTKRKKNFF